MIAMLALVVCAALVAGCAGEATSEPKAQPTARPPVFCDQAARTELDLGQLPLSVMAEIALGHDSLESLKGMFGLSGSDSRGGNQYWRVLQYSPTLDWSDSQRRYVMNIEAFVKDFPKAETFPPTFFAEMEREMLDVRSGLLELQGMVGDAEQFKRRVDIQRLSRAWADAYFSAAKVQRLVSSNLLRYEVGAGSSLGPKGFPELKDLPPLCPTGVA